MFIVLVVAPIVPSHLIRVPPRDLALFINLLALSALSAPGIRDAGSDPKSNNAFTAKRFQSPASKPSLLASACNLVIEEAKPIPVPATPPATDGINDAATPAKSPIDA